MNILLVPMGSSGDVHPFVGLGLALKARGHDVTLITGAYFEPLVRGVGLDCVVLGSVEDFEAATADRKLWHARKGLHVVARLILPFLPRLYELIAERYVPGRTVVVAPGLAFGARIANEKLGVPLATVHLQPFCFRSVYDMPVLPMLALPSWCPRRLKRLLYWVGDLDADRAVAADTNAFRATLGLPPVKRLFGDWWHSPRLVVGLFPDWFGPPQPDWPAQTTLTGFPLYDESDAHDVSPQVHSYLDGGEPPIVFTPGSAMRHGRPFFEAAVEACRTMGRRGILLSRYAEHVPQRLPDGVRHFDYVPLSRLLPRAAALVHHGGIGTLAQGLAAGVPQLLMPMAFDQPDNAARLTRLGAGTSLRPRAFRGPAVAEALQSMIDSKPMSQRCRELGAKVRAGATLERACAAVERLVQRV